MMKIPENETNFGVLHVPDVGGKKPADHRVDEKYAEKKPVVHKKKKGEDSR